MKYAMIAIAIFSALIPDRDYRDQLLTILAAFSAGGLLIMAIAEWRDAA